MRLKDYHRLVQHNYSAVEGIAVRPGGSRVRAYLPFVLLLLGLLIGVAGPRQVLERHAAGVRAVYPWIDTSNGMIRIATMFVILIIGLIAGPAVSL